MLIESYDHISGTSLGYTSLTQLNFGDLIQYQHCVKPLVIRCVSDTTDVINNVKIYLEDKGVWKDSDYGYFISPDFTSNLQPGSSIFTHFSEVPDATSTSPNGINVNWYQDQSCSDYIWLDADIKQKIGMASANYRLFYDTP